MLRTGGCLCGAVRYTLEGPTTSVTYCHCGRCRRWHGHVGAYAAVDRNKLGITEQRGLRWYTVGEVRRGFCSECGSSLFFDEARLAKIAFTAGSVDAPTGLRSKAHIWLDSIGDYYSCAEDGLIRLPEGP